MKKQILFFLAFFLIKISAGHAQSMVIHGDFQDAYPYCNTASNLDPMYGISNACPVTYPAGGFEISNYFIGNANWSVPSSEPLMMWEGANPVTTPGGNTNYYVKFKLFNCSSFGCHASIGYNSITFSPLYTYTVIYQKRSWNVGVNGGISFSLWNDYSTTTFQVVYLDKANVNTWQTNSFSFIPTQTSSKFLISVGGSDTPQNEIDIDNIVITAVPNCCGPSIAYTNNTNVNPLPFYSKAANYITASTNVKVITGNNATFQAGQYVQLNPGFETQTSSDFLAFIAPCPTSAPVANAGPDLIGGCYDTGGGTASLCRPIGSPASVGVTYLWTSPRVNATNVISSVTSCSTSICGPLPGEFVRTTTTYLLTATNGCGTSSDDMTMSFWGCRIGKINDFDNVSTNEANIENNTSVYPNPTSGKLRLQIPANAASVHITIDDLKGTRIYESNSVGSQDIDLDNRESGIYILRTNIDGEIKNQKIILNK